MLRSVVRRARKKLARTAMVGYDRIRSLRPGYARALIRRGDELLSARRYDPALGCYDRFLRLKPDNVVGLYRRAAAMRRLNRSDEALAELNRALAINPDFVDALISKGQILRLRTEVEPALECYRRATRLRPDDSRLHSSLIFTLNFDPSATEVEKQLERAEWYRRHAEKFSAFIKPHDNDPDPERRIRIGYVSSYFRHDNAAYGFANAILNRDDRRFEVYCYSGTVDEDEVTARLREAAHHWRRTVELPDDDMAELIRRDRIDILIDCVGHMAGNRLLVFARKPAPIQVTAWGEPTGTGLKTIDYLLASRVLVPEENRPLFAERVIYQPNFTGFWTPDPLPDVGALPALERGYVTFGSFNRAVKLSHVTITCWAAILRRLPDARLVLKHPQLMDAALQRRLAAAFEQHGVAAARLVFIGGTDRQSHFAAYNAIDIALDPFPHSGGMTTLDALWMGVPVVSWPGKSVSSRWSATSLVPLGLSDFLADSAEAYVELAVAKAGDLESLAELRRSLRTRMATSEWGDGVRYCRAVEAAYLTIWRRWCEQRRACGERRGDGPRDASATQTLR